LGLGLLSVMATITFSGAVPPHLATDGVTYSIAAPADADVKGSLRSCGIRDLAGAEGRFKFAIGPEAAPELACLRARLPMAAIEKRNRWDD
jgi:hypothetical protein